MHPSGVRTLFCNPPQELLQSSGRRASFRRLPNSCKVPPNLDGSDRAILILLPHHALAPSGRPAANQSEFKSAGLRRAASNRTLSLGRHTGACISPPFWCRTTATTFPPASRSKLRRTVLPKNLAPEKAGCPVSFKMIVLERNIDRATQIEPVFADVIIAKRYVVELESWYRY